MKRFDDQHELLSKVLSSASHTSATYVPAVAPVVSVRNLKSEVIKAKSEKLRQTMPAALRTHSEAQDGVGPRMSVTPSLRPPGRSSLIFNAKPNQMGVIKKSSTSLARRIFQTFEQFDHSLRQTADTAHKMITFRRYSDDKNRDDRDPCVKRLVDHYSFDAFFGLCRESLRWCSGDSVLLHVALSPGADPSNCCVWPELLLRLRLALNGL